MELKVSENNTSYLVIENRDDAAVIQTSTLMKLGMDPAKSESEIELLKQILERTHPYFDRKSNPKSSILSTDESTVAINAMVYFYHRLRFEDERENMIEHLDAIGVKP